MLYNKKKLFAFCLLLFPYNLKANLFSYSASITGSSHYVWRGISQSSNLFAIQPSLTIQAQFTETIGLTGNYWFSQTNADDYSRLDENNEPLNRHSWENDLTLSVNYKTPSFGFSLGALQYIYSYGNDYRKWKEEGKNTSDPDSLEAFFILSYQYNETGLSYTQYMNQTNKDINPYHSLSIAHSLSTVSLNFVVGMMDMGKKGVKTDTTATISQDIEAFQMAMNVTAVSWSRSKETNNFPWISISYSI